MGEKNFFPRSVFRVDHHGVSGSHENLTSRVNRPVLAFHRQNWVPTGKMWLEIDWAGLFCDTSPIRCTIGIPFKWPWHISAAFKWLPHTLPIKMPETSRKNALRANEVNRRVHGGSHRPEKVRDTYKIPSRRLEKARDKGL